jgi:hypothetical protein
MQSGVGQRGSSSQAAGPVRLPVVAGVYLVLLVLLCVPLAWHWPFGAEDFWAHAAVGRWIVENGQVPRQALFLWSSDEPWIAHSWLSQVTFYGLLRAGVGWVQLFAIGMVAASFAVLWRVWRRQAPNAVGVPAVLFAVAIGFSADRFQARPELFTGLFLAVLLSALVGWPREPSPGRRDVLRVAAVALLFPLWVNCHGQAALGVALLLVTAACEWVQTGGSRQARLLAVAGALSAAGLLLNPYGVRYWEAYRGTTGVVFTGIREWMPIWQTPTERPEVVIAAAALTLLAVVSWLANPDRRWAHLAWLVLLGACYLRARRFVWLLNLTSLAVLAANVAVLDLQRWRRGRRGKPTAEPTGTLSWLGRAVVGVVLLVAVVMAVNDIPTPREEIRFAPAGVADFILERRIPGRIFNDYENSSYFQWRFGGRPPLFIDLLNVYSEEVQRDYDAILEVNPRGVAALDERQIGCVILTTIRPHGVTSLKPLADFLDRSSNWIKVHGDGEGSVWVRRTREYEYLWRSSATAPGR